MDAAGIDMQVLSLSAVEGSDKPKADDASSLIRDSNDLLAEAIRRHPKRYAGFAALALQDPERAAAELERCVDKLGFVGAMVDGTVDGSRCIPWCRLQDTLRPYEWAARPVLQGQSASVAIRLRQGGA
jgi:Amidohydrolase